MRVLFLGRIADHAGPERSVDTEGLSTVADVTAKLVSEIVDAEPLLTARSTIIVLDESVVQPDAKIAGARELAYLPPVGGG